MEDNITIFNQLYREDTGRPAASHHTIPLYGPSRIKEEFGRPGDVKRAAKSPVTLFSAPQVFRRILTTCIAVLSVVVATACTPFNRSAQETESTPPTVSYDFNSDEGLIEANDKARAYCSQYASMASMRGQITQNSDGSRSVNFECVKTAVTAPPPPPPLPPMQYGYRTDRELLQAIESADVYCAQSGRVASSRVVTNADGSKTLTYQCVPR